MKMLTLAIPCKSTVHARFMLSVLQSLEKVERATKYRVTVQMLVGKSNIAHARSIMLSQWYDQSDDSDLFLFIDSDHIFDASDVIKAIEMTQKSEVVCGIYSNALGRPNAYPYNFPKFLDCAQDDRLLYAGTGFMMITRPICTKIKQKIYELDGTDRIWIGNVDNERNVIPFFNLRYIQSELTPGKTQKEWLGEDYSFCWMTRLVGGTIRGFISKYIGHEVMNVKHFYPNDFISKRWDKNSLVFYCGMSPVEITPKDKKLGGSEKAVVNITKELSSLKKLDQIILYGYVAGDEIHYNVKYEKVQQFNESEMFDKIVLWRGFGLQALPYIKANEIYVDLHDHTRANLLPLDQIDRIKKIFVKSNYHRSLYPFIPDSKFEVIPNGVEDIFFEDRDDQTREGLRFCYTSCYTRGLDLILRYVWPIIHRELPEAKLDCMYGMDLLPEDRKQYMQKLLDYSKSMNVVDHGRLTIKEVYEMRKKSSFHLYLSTASTEIDCISVRESCLLGCIPLISNSAVFAERDGEHFDMEGISTDDFGVVLNEEQSSKMQKIAEQIVSIVKDSNYTKSRSLEIKEKALASEVRWSDVAKLWDKALSEAGTIQY